MSEYLKLAGLLEEAARLLRKADAALAAVPEIGGPDWARWYGQLSSRARGALRHAGIKSFRDLEEATAVDILGAPGAGMGTLQEIQTHLARVGKKLREDDP